MNDNNGFIPNPLTGNTVVVASWIVDGMPGDVQVLLTTRPALMCVREWIQDSGDSKDWVERAYGDDIIFEHKTLDRKIVVALRTIRDWSAEKDEIGS